MFYLFVGFHILIFIEVFILMKKKLRKTGILLFTFNFLMMILNLFALSKTLNIDYSSIIYFKEELKQHPIANIFWIIGNVFQFVYLKSVIKFATKRQKQNRLLKYFIYSFSFFICSFFTLGIVSKAASFLLFLLCLLLLFLSVHSFFKTKKNYFLLGTLGIFFFLGYFYFTAIGSAQLCLILSGYPIEAMETGFEELKYYQEDNVTKLSPIETIPLRDGQVEIIEVKKIGFIKFSKLN